MALTALTTMIVTTKPVIAQRNGLRPFSMATIAPITATKIPATRIAIAGPPCGMMPATSACAGASRIHFTA
jgi:hypothetical protein